MAHAILSYFFVHGLRKKAQMGLHVGPLLHIFTCCRRRRNPGALSVGLRNSGHEHWQRAFRRCCAVMSFKAVVDQSSERERIDFLVSLYHQVLGENSQQITLQELRTFARFNRSVARLVGGTKPWRSLAGLDELLSQEEFVQASLERRNIVDELVAMEKRIFQPTDSWQEVKPYHICPPGLEYSVDLHTGLTLAKWP